MNEQEFILSQQTLHYKYFQKKIEVEFSYT